MTPLNKLLDRLDNPRKYANGYRCKCPAHDGNSKSTLSIKEAENGSVLIHCFAGCGAAEILHSVGLEMSDLYERPAGRNLTPQERQEIREAVLRRQWRAALKSLPIEIAVVRCAAVSIANNKPIDINDHKRLDLAIERITNAEGVLCGH